jgi:hypothetical protein
MPEARALTWPRIRRIVLQAIIAAVLAAAAIAIYAIIVGTFGVVEQKLLLVVLVFIGFAFFALFDAGVVSKRSDRLAIISVTVALYLLVAGILKVALAETSTDGFGEESGDFSVWSEFGRWFAMAFVARVSLLWVWLLYEMRRAARRPMLRLLAAITTALVAVLAVLLTVPLIWERTDFVDAYWRATAVAAVLALLGTALLPLLRWFLRERTAPPAPPAGTRRLAWPRFEDGTPLPADAQGRPDYSVLTEPTASAGPDTATGR